MGLVQELQLSGGKHLKSSISVDFPACASPVGRGEPVTLGWYKSKNLLGVVPSFQSVPEGGKLSWNTGILGRIQWISGA